MSAFFDSLSDLEQTILRTIAYFASFSYPLTPFEIWKWQKTPLRRYTYLEIEKVLEDLSWTKGKIASFEGWYGWVDEKTGSIEEQRKERSRRYVHSFRKERRLRSVLRWMCFLPFVEGIAVCNTLALHAASSRSDIDLFVVAKPGRIWTVRWWMVFPLMLLRARPGEAKQDPIDTNFFVTSHALDVSPLLLPEGDPYFLYWAATLSPVVNRGRVFDQFWQNNPWISKELPALHPSRRLCEKTKQNRWIKFGLIPESWARRIQQKRFPRDTRALLGKDTRVVANDAVLKFHKNDRRAMVKHAYEERLESL